MVSLTQQLQNEQILYAENVITLRKTIASKYPLASEKERAQILAKAMKRILYTHLSSFDQETQDTLVGLLIKTSLQKEDFSINAYDVITSYETLDRPAENALTDLTTWLHQTTNITPSKEEIQTSFTFLAPVNPPLPILETPEEMPTLITSTLPVQTTFPFKKLLYITGSICLVSMIGTATICLSSKPEPLEPVVTDVVVDTPQRPEILIPESDYLMPHLQYKEVNETALKEWLTGRNSLLSEEPYFSTIIEAAASYNINPLLMFAITGQEQGFVPKDHKSASKIANNPFNVYGSWQDFNTDIKDTAFIAARTIINLSKGCPSEADPIKWLNQKYAEDQNWHKGVTALLNQLEEASG